MLETPQVMPFAGGVLCAALAFFYADQAMRMDARDLFLKWMPDAHGIFSWRFWALLRRGSLCAGVLCCGVLWGHAYTHLFTTGVIQHGRYIGWLEGRVIAASRAENGAMATQRIVVRVRQGAYYDRQQSIYDESAKEGTFPDSLSVRLTNVPQHIKAGDWVRLRVILYPVPAMASPYGYNLQRSMYFRDIYGLGRALGDVFVQPESPADAQETGQDAFWIMVQRLRGDIFDFIVQTSRRWDHGALLASVTVGLKQGIPDDINTAFREAGIAHILAISGLHMGLFTFFTYMCVLRGMCMLWPALAMRRDLRRGAAVAALVSGCVYVVLAGGSVSALRAMCMATVFFLGVMFGKRTFSLQTVAVAALCLLVLQPYAVLEPGFQMSFAAVIALVIVYARQFQKAFERKHNAQKQSAESRIAVLLKVPFIGHGVRIVGHSVFVACVAGFATAPFAVLHFGAYGVAGIVSNSLVVPLFSFFVLPLAFIGILCAMWPAVATVCFSLAGWGVQLIIDICQHINQISPYYRGVALGAPEGLFVLAFMALCVFVCYRGIGGMVLAGTIYAVCMIWADSYRLPEGILIDPTGQRMAYVSKTGQMHMLVGQQNNYVVRHWSSLLAPPKAPIPRQNAITPQCYAAACLIKKQDYDVWIAFSPRALAEICQSLQAAAIGVVVNVSDVVNPMAFCKGSPVPILSAYDISQQQGGIIIFPDHRSSQFIVRTTQAEMGARIWNRATQAPMP